MPASPCPAASPTGSLSSTREGMATDSQRRIPKKSLYLQTADAMRDIVSTRIPVDSIEKEDLRYTNFISVPPDGPIP